MPSVRRRHNLSKNKLNMLLAAVRVNPKDIGGHLALAEYYLRNHLEEKIIKVLDPLEKRYPFTDNNQCAMYNRLLAFGYTHVDQIMDAEKICVRGMAEFPDALDFIYVRCYIHLSLREYDKVITSAQLFLERWEKAQKSATTPVDISSSKNHLSQIHNFYGSALFEKTEWDEAKKQFELSRKANPGNELPYINLANIALRHNDTSTARAVANQGLSKCRKGHELRNLLESLSNQATISACMIVKDEEELLPGCLDSVRDWVDEIIVVDTGSTDRTVEIAESYGAKIFHQPWEGNFSKHRNYSIELATCDWIFIIDADERFNKKDVPLLLDSVNRDEHKVISVNVFNLYGSVDHKLTSVNSVRFFRRELNLRYRGIVHNSPQVPKGTTISRAPITMEHLGYDLSPEKMKAKFERSKALLEKQIEENPDFAFAWFNLAQLYRGFMNESLEKYGPLVLQAAERAVE
ncbi:MAG: glycosyltransferase, partial [candidate division Zixibacteria bacterium]|nr:glycosyltransferase [candidate division Zixibacteria bacterium]